MRRWYWGWRTESSLYQPREEIKKEFEFATAVSEEEDRFHHRERGWLFSYRYEWVLSSNDELVQVTENGFISWVWWIIAGGTFWMLFIGITLFTSLPGIWKVVVLVLELFSVVGWCASLLAMMRKKSPVFDLTERGSNHELYIPTASYLLPSSLLLALELMLPGIPFLVGSIGATVILVIYSVRHDTIAALTFRWQNWMTDRTRDLPMVAGKYIVFMLLSMVAIYVFLESHDGLIFIFFMSRNPFVTSLLFSMVFLLYLGLIRQILLYDTQRSEISRFKRKGRNLGSWFSVLITGLAAVAVSLGFAYLSYLFVFEAAEFLSEFRFLPAALLVFVAAMPILYILTGLFYQFSTAVFGLLNLYRRLHSQDFSDIYHTEAGVYTLDSEKLFAGATSIGARDVIIVSEQMVELLEPDELVAILAHEESHIEHGDNRLASFIAIVSPALLTAKNVLYAVFDFREREYRADREAAEKTSPDDLKSALQKIQIYTGRKKAESSERFENVMPTLTSFTDQDKSPGFWQRYFGFFYGGFAVLEAHPSLSERIQNLSK